MIVEALAMELDHAVKQTHTLLERLPEDRLGWRPHPKAYSLGQLALHLGQIPSIVSAFVAQDVSQFPTERNQAEAGSRAEAARTLDEGHANAKAALARMSDAALSTPWKLERDGQELMTVPRMVLFREFLLNHFYHHRGQLTTYLRTLDVPLPSTYGPTADVDPFAAPAAT
ncbi:MAG: DinB family protein [Gemmatimonadales bacterium]